MKSKKLDVEYFANYLVVVEQLKSGVNGNPRFDATVCEKNPTQTWSAGTKFRISCYGNTRQVAEKAIEMLMKESE